MGRPKKKEIVLSKDSVLSLMQEIYNELVEQRGTAVRIQNKMLAMLKRPKRYDCYRSCYQRTTKNN